MTSQAEGQQQRWQRVCAVLDAVFDAPDSERERVLAKYCQNDPDLRVEVEAMLAAEATTDRRVDTPAADWAGEVLDDGEQGAEPPQAHVPGEMIGEYRLVRELGRGGMGAVWLAERVSEQFQQQVALKLLKRGLDTDAVLQRFYEERRILARLRHPHIALFLDGGVSDTGQPWFTMEWVDGAPITKWCDARKLDIRGRVSLFLDAVAAVQYAHQQLIVHRDLKPGNMLVSESGEVKLLDFGIAKLLDEAEGSAEAATMTRMGVRMLTPEYAAPEQIRGEPANAATDVYALGVLLHELLTGKRPVDKSRDVKDTALQRPSRQADVAAAGSRNTSADKLRRQLRGDLDTIILKAVHPEVARRYGSAQALGEDLQRWLEGLPVQARPDSAWYRTQRFIGRHWVGTAAVTGVVLALVAGAIVATWQAREANLQAQEARRQTVEAEKQKRRAEQIKDFLIEIFRAGGPRGWKGKDLTAKDLLEIGANRVEEELRDDPMLRAQMQRVIGEIALSQEGASSRVETLLRTSMNEIRRMAGEESEDYADALHSWAVLLYLKGDHVGATRAAEREIEIRERGVQDDQNMAQALGFLASLKNSSGSLQEVIELRRKAVDVASRAPEGKNSIYAEHILLLGMVLLDARRFEEALPLIEESLSITKTLNGPDSLEFAVSLNGYGRLMSEKGDLGRASEAYREAAVIFNQANSAEDLIIAAYNQGDVLCRMGRFSDAENSFREAWQAQQRFESAHWVDPLNFIRGRCLSDAGKFSSAEPLLHESAGVMDDTRDLERNVVLVRTSNVLRLRLRQGRGSEAVSVIAWIDRRFGPIRGSDSWQSALFLTAAAPVWFVTGEQARG